MTADAYSRIMGKIDTLDAQVRALSRRRRIVNLLAGFGAASLVLDLWRIVV